MIQAGTPLPPDPKGNRLLAALPEADYEALTPYMEWMAMPLGMAVYESGGPQGYV
jgi:hypothetical protein